MDASQEYSKFREETIAKMSKLSCHDQEWADLKTELKRRFYELMGIERP